ncbi:MAG: outer membrane beta-barrel protein [Weeksellaceae bacterium]|nr:outer membrane beta-barrel protein [Weeksellaceae bacterium]
MLKILFSVIATLVVSLSYAQFGTVEGRILDQTYGNVPFAYVQIDIDDPYTQTITDGDGQFSIELPEGTHIIRFSYVGYRTLEIPVNVVADQVTQINESMVADSGASTQLESVVVTARRTDMGSEAATITEIRQAKQVVSAISAQQIRRSTDSDAAEVVQRVPGIAIIDGRFVMVRGLDSRYNHVMINNSTAPSSEVDRRTFSFDLITTGAIENMTMFKSPTADKPGDFSGAVINIRTTEEVFNFNQVHLGVGYRVGTTFGEMFQDKQSATDYLGFDNGYRTLPGNFPSTAQYNQLPTSSATRMQLARGLRNNWNPLPQTPMLNSTMGLTIGRRKTFKNGHSLSSINSINHNASFLNMDRNVDFFFARPEGASESQPWEEYLDNFSRQEIVINLMSNWMYRFGRHRIKFKNLFNQVGQNEVVIREGYNFQQQPGRELRNYELNYTSRTMYIGQLMGEHPVGRHNFDWVLGGNYIYQDQPDLRRLRSFRDEGSSDSYEVIAPPSSNLFDTSRFFGELKEYSTNGSANFTYQLNEDNPSNRVKIGMYSDYKTRDFGARYFSYIIPGYVGGTRAADLRTMHNSIIFSDANVNNTDGWVLSEGTNPQDAYTSSNLLMAGYGQLEYTLGSFDVTAGLRFERNQQELQSQTFQGQVNVDLQQNILLPSLNVAYNLHENSLLRLAYGRTTNRPEFREIAPFVFYNFQQNLIVTGNPNLQNADIHNIDLRYEWYPSTVETISIGAFYKHFNNPIENILQIVTENRSMTFDNGDYARNFGAELEIRKSFRNVTNNPFINNLSINLNAAYIYSQVDLGERATAQTRVRPLQGQSPYILNVALGYDTRDFWNIGFIYNRIGDRIYLVGDQNFPDVYELSRDQLDFSISKKFNNAFSMKFGIKDILNAPYRLYMDADRNNRIDTNVDDRFQEYKMGQHISLSATINL